MFLVGSYLFQRVLADGKDSRFDEIKKSPPKFFGALYVLLFYLYPAPFPTSDYISILGCRVYETNNNL